MKHLLLFFLVASSLVGCSAKTEEGQPGAAVAGPAKPAAPVTSEPGPKESELKDALDLETYPGAKLVKSEIVKSKDIPEGETRYRIALETPDEVAKVVSFYEKQLGTGDTPMSDTPQVMGLTPRGHQTIVKIERKGEVTSISISNIGR